MSSPRAVKKPSVGVVIVNHNQKEMLRACLRSWQKEGYGADLLVSDNDSRDGALDMLRREFKGVRVLSHVPERGFAAAATAGLAALAGTHEYLFLTTNDTVVQAGLLDALVARCQAEPQLGAVGPKILFFDRPDLIWHAGGRINPVFGNPGHFGLLHADDGTFDLPRDCAFVSGCGLLLRSSAVSSVGFLRGDLGFYAEDSDLCQRLLQRGWRVAYEPAGRMLHRVSATLAAGSPLSDYYITRNSLALLWRYPFGPLSRLPLLGFMGVVLPWRAFKRLFLSPSPAWPSIRAQLLGLRDFLLGRYGLRDPSDPGRAFPFHSLAAKMPTAGRRLLVVDLNAGRAPQQEPYRLLARAGWEVLLLVPELWQEAFGGVPAETAPEPGLQIQALPVAFNGRYHRVLFRGLSRAVRSFQPDSIWLHAEPENFLAYQGLWARDRHGAGASLTLVSWRNIDYGRRGLPYRLPALHQAIEDALQASGAKLLCYNADAMRILGGLGFRVAPTKMGFNPGYFSPGSKDGSRSKLGLPRRARIAGFAGRFTDAKGVSDLIAAAARVPGLQLLLIGDGPAKSRWLQQARTAGVPVTVLALKHEAMADAFRAMDVLCLPSRTTAAWKEQFGRVLIEAMACGTPVLGSDSGAIPEVVAQGGIVHPEGDVAAMAAGLKSLLRDPPRAAALKRAAQFSWPVVAKDLDREFKAGPAFHFPTVSVQGCAVFSGDRDAALQAVDLLRDSGAGGRVAYLNAHTANLAALDPRFREVLREADLVLPDGAGILLAARMKGRKIPERLVLGDLVQAMAARCKEGIFLWGGSAGVAEAAAPCFDARIAGTAHGFQRDEAEIAQVIRRIRLSKARLVFLGMGSPKQELLALRLRRELPSTVVVACGNAFVFVAGMQSRAPLWLQRAHGEWLWRLGLEPRRMWRRYLLGNTRFMARALWESFGGRP